MSKNYTIQRKRVGGRMDNGSIRKGEPVKA